MLGSGLRPTAGLRSNLPSSFEIHPNGATVFAEPDPPNNAFDHLCGHSCRATGAIRRGPEHVGQSRAARKSRLLPVVQQERVETHFTVQDRPLGIHPGVEQSRRFHRRLNRGSLFGRYVIRELAKSPERRPVACPASFGIAGIRRRGRLMFALQESLLLVLKRAQLLLNDPRLLFSRGSLGGRPALEFRKRLIHCSAHGTRGIDVRLTPPGDIRHDFGSRRGRQNRCGCTPLTICLHQCHDRSRDLQVGEARGFIGFGDAFLFLAAPVRFGLERAPGGVRVRIQLAEQPNRPAAGLHGLVEGTLDFFYKLPIARVDEHALQSLVIMFLRQAAAGSGKTSRIETLPQGSARGLDLVRASREGTSGRLSFSHRFLVFGTDSFGFAAAFCGPHRGGIQITGRPHLRAAL